MLDDGPALRGARLRALGDALVPQVAAAFVEAFIEAIDEMKEGEPPP
jgi:hypothetical protein